MLYCTRNFRLIQHTTPCDTHATKYCTFMLLDSSLYWQIIRAVLCRVQRHNTSKVLKPCVSSRLQVGKYRCHVKDLAWSLAATAMTKWRQFHSMLSRVRVPTIILHCTTASSWNVCPTSGSTIMSFLASSYSRRAPGLHAPPNCIYFTHYTAYTHHLSFMFRIMKTAPRVSVRDNAFSDI